MRDGLDGIERGTGELERLAAGGVDVRNPPGSLVVAHDKLLTARSLRLAGLPHPHTALLSPALPAAVPELPVVLKPRFGSWGRDVERCATAEELDAALVRLQRQALVPRARRRTRAGARWSRGVRGPAARRRRRPGRRCGVQDRAPRRVADERRPRRARSCRWIPRRSPGALALAAAEATRADLVGVDLLPTPNGGFLVLEVNGAVDFRPLYAPTRDVFSDTVAALLEDGVRQPELAAASV